MIRQLVRLDVVNTEPATVMFVLGRLGGPTVMRSRGVNPRLGRHVFLGRRGRSCASSVLHSARFTCHA